MRLSSGSSLIAAIGLVVGMGWAIQPGAAQEGGAAPVQVAEAVPVIEPEMAETEGPDAISLAPWAEEAEADTVELAKSRGGQDPSADQLQAIQPLAATNSATSSGGSASAPGLGDSAPSERVDPFVGSFSTAVPIQVPGFHGIAPSLALTYNSSRGNGLAGVGWSLSGLSVIERASPGKGTPAYDGSDIFLLDGQELVPCVTGTISPSCDTGGTHATEVESYIRIKQDTTANTWEVTGRDGTLTTYTAVMGPNTTAPANTYRWAIASVVDTHTNTVTYSWWCSGTPIVQCYAETIAYNGSTITFHWETRPDEESFALGTATLGWTSSRLRSVDVKTGPDRVRVYALNYLPESAATARSVLGNIQMFGTDATVDASGAVTAGTSLPATVFSYSSQAQDFAAGAVWSTEHSAVTYDADQVRYADVSGDGRADMVFRKSDNTIWVSLAEASGFGTASQWAAPGGSHQPDQASLADIDGDGKADLIFRKPNNEIGVFISNGSGFTAPTSWLSMGGDYQSGQALFGDVNGDGRADLIFRKISTTCHEVTRRARHCGPGPRPSCPAGYNVVERWTTQGGNCGGGGDETERTYHVRCRDCDIQQDIHVGLSSGTGFDAPTEWLIGLAGNDGDYEPDQVQIADFNGDGLSDMSFRGPSNALTIGLSTGSAFTEIDPGITLDGTYQAGQVRFADVNGDGKSDLIFREIATTTCQEVVLEERHCGPGGSGPACPTGYSRVDSWTVNGGSCGGGGDEHQITVYFKRCQDCDNRQNVQVALSTGAGFTSPTLWFTDLLASNGDYDASQVKLADFNGDGRADLSFRLGSSVLIAVSDGESFADTGMPISLTTGYTNDEFQIVDIDGNGRVDLVQRGDNQTVTTFLAAPGAAPTDVLTSVTNPLGGTTTVAYTPSSAWTNQTLPMVLQTVSAITTDDGRGNTATTSYAYEGGLWDAEERRFLGFRMATTTLPCIAGEAQCPYTETTFRQDRASAGRVEQADRFDGAGTLLTRAVEEYDVNDTISPYTALNIASESHIIVGAVTRRTRVTREFDDYANVVLETAHGDADVLGDEITAATDYSPATGDYIVSLPARIRSFEGADTTGTLLTESRILYDGATDWATPPVRGDPTETQDWLDTAAGFIVSSAVYDGSGNLKVSIDPLGRRTEIDYETGFNLYPIAQRNPLFFAPSNDTRHQTSTQWDTVCGVPTVATDLNGNDTTTQYDALCRPIRTDLPDGGFTITSYNSLGDPTAQYVETQTPPADGSGNVWARVYMDGFGRPYRSTAKGPAVGQGITADTAYDDRGNVASQTAPYYTGDPVYSTTFDYDALDRPVAANHPDGNWTETDYGVAGVFVSTTTTDELGHPVTLHLDAFGRAVRKEEPLGAATVKTDYTYDALGRLTGIADDVENTWAYTHDSLGRTLTIDDPDLGVWTKTYDNAGQLLTQTDALGQVTRFTYDALGRMLTKTARDGTAQAELTTYTYDEAVAGFHNMGLMTRAENPSGILRYRYDPLGRETQRIYTIDGSDYTLASGFDIAGQLIWQDYPDGDSVGSALDPITYDATGRLYAVPGLVTHTAYDAGGNAEAVAFANGVVTGYGYSDHRGWLDSLVTLSGAATVQNMTYGRDPAGQITSVASPLADESWTYGYDALRRLLSATNIDNAAHSRTYTYDTVGNMLTNSGVTGTYSYPAAGSPRPHAVTSVGSWNYTYDANGNMLTGAGRTYTYNGDNLPTQIDTQAYTYGPDGERWKTVDSAPGGGTTLYLGGSIEIAAGVMTKYLPGSAKRVGSPGDPLVETFWLHHDHQGSIQAITDAAGTQVQRFTYYPYGDRIATSTAHEESKGWIGERQDATGLFYLHARYYDPVIGRFNSADPSDPMQPGVGLNRYAYAGNSPVMRIDPWGLKFVGNDESEGGGTKFSSSKYGEMSPRESKWRSRSPSATVRRNAWEKYYAEKAMDAARELIATAYWKATVRNLPQFSRVNPVAHLRYQQSAKSRSKATSSFVQLAQNTGGQAPAAIRAPIYVPGVDLVMLEPGDETWGWTKISKVHGDMIGDPAGDRKGRFYDVFMQNSDIFFDNIIVPALTIPGLPRFTRQKFFRRLEVNVQMPYLIGETSEFLGNPRFHTQYLRIILGPTDFFADPGEYTVINAYPIHGNFSGFYR